MKKNGILRACVAGLVAGACVVSCSKDDESSSSPDKTPSYVEAVDLGLSVKWASCNVGATSPSDYGYYFAWGETTPKATYSWETYKFGGEYSLTKYCTDSEHGTVDNLTVLELEDDAARANWGGKWRIPTLEEWEELKANCKLEWTKVNGVKGCKITAANGNYIFLPAAGRNDDNHVANAGTYGSYWTRDLSNNVCYACSLLVNSNSKLGSGKSTRYRGQSVRAVCP